MERLAEEDLVNWYNRNRRKPLIIRGARQVGKSTLVRNFTDKNNIKLHEINLEQNLHLADAFKSMNPDLIIEEIQRTTSNKISPTEILFIDEIQAIPEAIAALRYLYEEKPGMPILAAGSLLEVVLSKANFSMPVGRVEFMYLGPMLFSEFCLATDNDDLVEFCREYNLDQMYSQAAHKRLLDLFRFYLTVGGMPEAVLAYSETFEVAEAQRVHSSILETYRNDFGKYSTRPQSVRLNKVVDQLPTLIGKKLKFSNIDPNEQSRDLSEAVDLLCLAGFINKVYHSDSTAIPLKSGVNYKVYKPYVLDCGLSSTMRGADSVGIKELSNSDFFSDGSLAEQFISQHLFFKGGSTIKPENHYWLREGKQGNAEVGFVQQFGNEIVPIEVKAGTSGSLKSLLQFLAVLEAKIGVRFDINQPSQMKFDHKVSTKKGLQGISGKLLSLPSYLVEQLPRLYTQTQSVDH